MLGVQLKYPLGVFVLFKLVINIHQLVLNLLQRVALSSLCSTVVVIVAVIGMAIYERSVRLSIAIKQILTWMVGRRSLPVFVHFKQ